MFFSKQQRKVEVKDHFVRLRRERSDGEFGKQIIQLMMHEF